ncbi:LAQU0S35e00210g1_1 [Lachancea quebecensis]|uniref:LAQU0S35e00210g1_1 n=1 Tax=Lachancea quebecensis TaxID=1654605 RepID=A0A0P1KYA2_9SACH|nr:LAQU0S35e00210g1_1 [Lachancea quebecensis]
MLENQTRCLCAKNIRLKTVPCFHPHTPIEIVPQVAFTVSFSYKCQPIKLPKTLRLSTPEMLAPFPEARPSNVCKLQISLEACLSYNKKHSSRTKTMDSSLCPCRGEILLAGVGLLRPNAMNCARVYEKFSKKAYCTNETKRFYIHLALQRTCRPKN